MWQIKLFFKKSCCITTSNNRDFFLVANVIIFIALYGLLPGVKQPHTTPPVVVPVMINTTSRKYQDLNVSLLYHSKITHVAYIFKFINNFLCILSKTSPYFVKECKKNSCERRIPMEEHQ